MPNLIRLQWKQKKAGNKLVNYSILKKEKKSACAIAVSTTLFWTKKTKKLNKPTISHILKFGKGIDKTNSDSIANIMKTVQNKVKQK